MLLPPTVAAATEELASSVAEIGRQVTHSSTVADSAVLKAGQTTEMVGSLAAFEARYNAIARPFNWKFTRADLSDLLRRIDARDKTKTNALAA